MNNTVTKNSIAKKIFYELGLPTSISLSLVDDLFKEIITSVSNKEILKISNFGTFSVRIKNPRIGRNLNNKQEVIIGSRKVALFSASKHLKQKVNELGTSEE